MMLAISPIELNNYLVTFEDDTTDMIGHAKMYEDALMIRFDLYSSTNFYDTSIWYGQSQIKKVEISNTVPSDCSANIYPADLSTGISVNPALTWSSVNGATRYSIYFSTDGIDYVTQGSYRSLSYTVPNAGPLEYSTTYYWYVVPTNDNGEAVGCESTATSFTTISEPTTTTTSSSTTTTTTVDPML